jgi:transcriptional regulator with XRE-family HTH domain
MPNIHSQKYKIMLKKLVEARNESGMSQTQVAKKLSKPQSYISKCESGERRIDVIELTGFAQLYNKTLDYFIE